ncbi:unnamed protein product [Amoebophrya sp. A25]|nr:unnamed protein product [Amoebophrya sp. A25]|eukprot:GSA25T00000092001.1
MAKGIASCSPPLESATLSGDDLVQQAGSDDLLYYLRFDASSYPFHSLMSEICYDPVAVSGAARPVQSKATGDDTTSCVSSTFSPDDASTCITPWTVPSVGLESLHLRVSSLLSHELHTLPPFLARAVEILEQPEREDKRAANAKEQRSGSKNRQHKVRRQQSNKQNKLWEQNPLWRKFRGLYSDFVSKWVAPQFSQSSHKMPPEILSGCRSQACGSTNGERDEGKNPVEHHAHGHGQLGRMTALLTQEQPVLRVVFPHSTTAPSRPHRDLDYGHLPQEVNYWVPLSQLSSKNSLYCESLPGAGDYAPFNGGVGDCVKFWGMGLHHYAHVDRTKSPVGQRHHTATDPVVGDCQENEDSSTRVSFDFRVLPVFHHAEDVCCTLSTEERFQLDQRATEFRQLVDLVDFVGNVFRQSSACYIASHEPEEKTPSLTSSSMAEIHKIASAQLSMDRLAFVAKKTNAALSYLIENYAEIMSRKRVKLAENQHGLFRCAYVSNKYTHNSKQLQEN